MEPRCMSTGLNLCVCTMIESESLCIVIDFSGHTDLEPLELLESDSESLRSFEVHVYTHTYMHIHQT